MIYASERFKKVYSELSIEFKQGVHEIVEKLYALTSADWPGYLASLCGDNGKALWTGINKTLYHLYPLGQNSVHRLFYCYTTDLDENVQNNSNALEGVVFLDYSVTKEQEKRKAKIYEREALKYISEFSAPLKKESEAAGFTHKFWFCLTSEQRKVLDLKQPALVNGSAGTGKTIISFELMKQWLYYDSDKKYLYLTYTDNLLKRARDSFKMDGIDINSNNFKINQFSNLIENSYDNQIIDEYEARNIIKKIIEGYKSTSKTAHDIIFSDYFVYSYIRGIMKGHFQCNSEFELDNQTAGVFINDFINRDDLSINEKNKIKRILLDKLRYDEISEKTFKNEILLDITNLYNSKKDKIQFEAKVTSIFTESMIKRLNELRVPKNIYRFLSDEEIEKELRKDKVPDLYIRYMIEIKKKYNEELKRIDSIDDNDYAMHILNIEITEDEKYDGIIVDEIQDLTETQIKAIVKLSKSYSNNISLFGDQNQTINPTVYDYGRFNSYVYTEKEQINRKNLKITHRCGPNLLEYINHLTSLRSKLKLTTEREDLEPEVSANPNKADTNWACLAEDTELIQQVLYEFPKAVDCYLIVDNEATKKEVIEIIKTNDDFDDDPNIFDQIITVQNAKGLESKSVIIYNLISDNLDIFKELSSLNNKISTMTFNKLYVSTTRAEDSIIICESKLKNEVEIKEMLFKFSDSQMIEALEEDEIRHYLDISIEPEVFIRQALKWIEDKNFVKANKKNNVAIKNILKQFEKDEKFDGISLAIKDNPFYEKMQNYKDRFSTNEIEEYQRLYGEFIGYLEDEVVQLKNQQNTALIMNLTDHEISLLKERYEELIESIRIRKICEKRIEFDEYKSAMRDQEKMPYLEDFSLLDNYDSAMEVATNLSKAKSQDYQNIVRYIFGYETFDKVKGLLTKIEFSNPEVYKLVLDNQMIGHVKEELKSKIARLRGLINE